MDPTCITPVAANCRDTSTEPGVCFKVKATGAILHGSVTTTFNCANGGVVTGKTFVSDAGVSFPWDDVVEIGCPPMVLAAPMAGVTSGGAGPGGGLTNVELRAAPVPVVDLGNVETNNRIGAVDSGVASSDTGGTANLNSRLQRLTYRVSQLVGQLPVTIGAKNTAGSLSLTLAGDSQAVAVKAAVNGGAWTSRVLSVAGTNSTIVKTTTANLYGWQLVNLSNAAKFVKVYNKTTTPAPGTDVDLFTIAIPPGGTQTGSIACGVILPNGFGYSIVGGVANGDVTPIAAGEVVGAFFYV